MLTLDIALFPHIFDTIFESADYKALLRLRLTCRALRDRIHDEWGHLKWVAEDGYPVAAVNRRGIAIPCDSPHLSLTTVLDIGCADEWCDYNEVPSHCRPQIIRIFCLGTCPLTARAKTIIILDQEEGDSAGNYIESPLCPQDTEPINLIYNLDCRDWDTVSQSGTGFFPYVGRTRRPANVYLLLSGCNPAGDCVKDLCYFIMEAMTGYGSGVREDPVGCKVRPYFEHDFYFVDVRSWFDTSLTTLPGNHPDRLDRVLTRPSTFYSHMLTEVGYGFDVDSDGEGEYERAWPNDKVLERVFKRLHYITREEMRERVGDRAYELTFAPRDICAP